MTCEPRHSKRPGAYIGGVAIAWKRGCGYKPSIGKHRSSACPPQTVCAWHASCCTTKMSFCMALGQSLGKPRRLSDCPLQQMHWSITQDMMSPNPKGSRSETHNPKGNRHPQCMRKPACYNGQHPFHKVRTQVPSRRACWHCHEGQSAPGATVSTLCTLQRPVPCRGSKSFTYSALPTSYPHPQTVARRGALSSHSECDMYVCDILANGGRGGRWHALRAAQIVRSPFREQS